MAEEKQTAGQPEAAADAPKKKGSKVKNLIVYGVPAFLVQVVVIYFLTAKFILPAVNPSRGATTPAEHSEKGSANSETASADDDKNGGDSKEQYIYIVKDMIINPAGTNGQRYLLTTIAFNLSSEEAMKALESKEMAVRDALNSILTSKTMEQLIDVAQRENLRQEIAAKTKELVTRGKLKSVYFSKYIIQ